MSTIYFHSPSGEAKVPGRERNYFNWLCYQSLLAILDLKTDTERNPHPLRYAFPSYANQYHGQAWTTKLTSAIVAECTMGIDTLKMADYQSNLRTVAFNTTMVIGSDQLKLATRIHGQCGSHAFVEGSNRAWLANIIERGLHNKIFRTESGWENVIELFRSSNNEPVVTSFSVTNSFPNPDIAIKWNVWSPPEAMDEGDYNDAWSALPVSEQWRIAMEALRLQNQKGNETELKPENWDDYLFEDGITAFDIIDHFKTLAEFNQG